MSTSNSTFDASAHMRKIRTRQGMQEYLDVKWRVAWLRADHPAAQIITEQVEGDAEHARFKCTISYDTIAEADGGGLGFQATAIGTGHGSETLIDFPDFYEKAETKAIGRACAALGYGTDAAIDFDDGEPLDGRGAAKDERAERRNAPQAPPRAETPPPAQSTPQRPNATPVPAPARVPVPSVKHGEWRDGDADIEAPRVDANGHPVPSIAQEAKLQNAAVQKGMMIPDGSSWKYIANLVAATRAGRADVGWPAGKLITTEVWDALNALPDAR